MKRDAGLRQFDRLLVWKVSRLGRDMREVISTVYELACDKAALGQYAHSAHSTARVTTGLAYPAIETTSSASPVGTPAGTTALT